MTRKNGTLLLCLAMLLLAGTAQAAGKTKPAKKPEAAKVEPAAIDKGLVGTWGVDSRGGYEFRADGTFVMEGAVHYRYDATGGVWRYWLPSLPSGKTSADYKLSADGKSLEINLKQGTALTRLIKVK